MVPCRRRLTRCRRSRAVEAAAEQVQSELGPIDVWVNNAMATVFAPVADTEPDEFRRVTEVTYLGAVWGSMSALRRMRPRDRGVVIQVGSALAYRGIPLQAAYCGSKHALQGFFESIRSELLHDGSNVGVTMVQLPALNTPQFTWSRAKMAHRPRPVPPVFQPEVAADAIVYAAHHSRRELTLGWPTLEAAIGNALAPSLADRVLSNHGYRLHETPSLLDASVPGIFSSLVEGDQGAHGPFDDEAKAYSIQLWATKHRRLLGLAGATALSAAVLGLAAEGR